MEVLSLSKRHAGALEMVSDAEEEEICQESEQEEGEICSEDEEEGVMEGEMPSVFSNFSSNANNSLPAYASHFSSFLDHRPSKAASMAKVASEVIYDDSGRTAIFTSPKKPRTSSYSRRGEVSRHHARELSRRKEKESDRSRRHHSTSSLQTSPEKWSKMSRRSSVENKGTGLSQEGHGRPYRIKAKDVSGVRGPHRPRKNRPPSPESSSRSSSCSSCSSSSSSSSLRSCSLSEEEINISSVSPCKGRGKENRRCGPAGKSHDRSHSQEYGCEPPPPAKEPSKLPPQLPAHRPKYSGSQYSSSHHRPPATHSKEPKRRPSTHGNSRRSPKESVVSRAARQQHQKPSKVRPSERKDSSKVEKSVKEAESGVCIVKGQNRLPRGSLGEMLLSRPKASSTQPAPGLQDIPRPPGEDPKAPALPTKSKKQQEEKVVQEVVLDSHTSSEGVNSTLDQEDDEELRLRLVAIQSSLRLLTDMQREGQAQEGAGEEEAGHTSGPTEKTGGKDGAQRDNLKDLPQVKDSGTPPVIGGGGQESHRSCKASKVSEADATVVQISDDIISISSSSASEICSENLATNTSYLEEGGRGKAVEDSRRRGKERPDVDQDPVDMEICDSSGEEEGVQSVVVQDSPLSPEPGQDTGKPAVGDVLTGVGSSNFQMPVEWAYMMPPPPPPDQPANDLHNINNWCFDQNMYLQAMQVAPQEEEEQQQQQQQGQGEAASGSEWLAAAQPHTSSWPDPFLEAYNNDITLPQDTSNSIDLAMGLPSDQHQHQQDQHQHPLEYDYPESAVLQDASPSGQGSDLKDAPAEHYQAFMSAVLQQQQQPSPKGRAAAAATTAFTECPQRNLIMVPLSGSHQSAAAAATAAKASKKAKAKTKKMRTKKRVRKKVLQECSGGSSQPQVNSGSTEAAGAAAAVVEDEDEELLRAKLLIDMSRKKEQRLLGTTTLTTTTTTTISTTITTASTTASTSTALSAPFPPLVNRAKEGQEGRASPQTLHQPSEALVPFRSLRVVKGLDGRPRSGGSSPTHSLRGEARQGLSDIGGWGLDPKGSKFNYHSNAQHDFPQSSSSSSGLDVSKVKFPTIQPIIINLQSDSDDSAEEGDGSGGERPSAEPMSQSIDILLKSMRNANMPSTSKEPEPSIPKPGPSTPSTSSAAAPSSPAARPRDVADSTPQAVRHLSRHQQEEYRWLKEQLRKKEMLQRRKMLQRPVKAKPQPKPPPPPPLLPPLTLSPDQAQNSGQSCGGSPVHTDPSSLSSGSEGLFSTRAVTWKDMGLLQIQVQNDAALDLSSEGTDSGERVKEAQDDSSASASAVEDDDVEALRRMALRTQRTKKAEGSPEKLHRRVIVQDDGSENDVDTEVRECEEDVSLEVSSEELLEEGLRGEWMVLDEVREEGTEAGEDELCAKPSDSSAEELQCGEGTDMSDDAEEVVRYPSNLPWTENQNKDQQALRMTDETESKEQAPRTRDEEQTKEKPNTDGKKTYISVSEAPQTTPTATSPSRGTPDQPAAEDGPTTQPDTKQQDPSRKPDVQAPEFSGNKTIEEVIKKIENKTRVVRGASREASPAEVHRGSVPSAGGTKKQVSAVLPSRNETKVRVSPAAQKPVNLISLASYSKDKDSSLVKPSHSTTTTTTATTTTTTTSTTTTTISLAGTVSRGTAGGQNQSRVPVSNQNGGHQRTVLPSGTVQKVVRKVQVVRPASIDSAGKDLPVTPPTAAVTTITAATWAQDTETPGKVQLKRLEKEYKEKKSGINKMVGQLSQLVKEVREEQQQQQELRNTITELKGKLRDAENQLQTKSSSIKTKLKRIWHVQAQRKSERQVLQRLEQQGEALGKQVYGAGFSFSESLPVSPQSKVKDVSTKKNLASSIFALQQQVRNLTNKQKNSLKTSTNANDAGVVVVRRQNAGESTTMKTTTTTITNGGVVRRVNTADNALKTSLNAATEADVARKQNTGNTTTKTTITTNSNQEDTESRVTKTINQDTKKEMTGRVEKGTAQSPIRTATTLTVQGVPTRSPHSRPPTNTQQMNGTTSPQGKAPPVKRKMSATGPGAVKVARVQVPKEDLPGAVPERKGAGLAPRQSSAVTNGAKEEDKLDEMKVLCPHDLLGRCNDTSCQYQHLPSARPAPQAQPSSSSSSQEPRPGIRESEPHSTTSTASKQGKVVKRAGVRQVKVTSSSAVPSERSSQEVKSQLLPDTHVSEQQHQTQTAVENGTASTALLETSDTQATTQTDTATSQTDAPTTQTDALTTEEQTGTPHSTVSSEMQVPTPTDTQSTLQTDAPTTEEQTSTPFTTTTDTEMHPPTPTDTCNATDTQSCPSQHKTETTDKQTVRHEAQTGTSVDSTELTNTDTLVRETDLNIDSQTCTAPTEPQETQTETETSAQGRQADEEATTDAQNTATTEPQRETEASTAHPETQTTEMQGKEEKVTSQTTTGNTETQTGAENTDIDKEPSANVTRELSDNSSIVAESEDLECTPSDVESQTSTTSSTDHLPSKCQPPLTSSRLAKRRASTRRSRESNAEDVTLNTSLTSEADSVEDHQEEPRITRKSLRVKAKSSPKGTAPQKRSAKASTSGKGQKRKFTSPSKHPSGKKRQSTKP